MASATPEPLDIDAWLSGAERPEDTIRISSKGKAVAERARLVKERDTTKARATGRMAAPADPASTKRIAELDKVIEAGMAEFRLRGMDSDAAIELQTDHKDAGSAFDEHLIARCLVSPVMDQAKVHKMRQAIGEGQFRRLARAAASLTFDSEPSADF